MIIKRILFLFFLILLCISCKNSVLDLNVDVTDPDPQDIGNLLEIPEDVFLAVNINGKIVGFDSRDPLHDSILAENASTDQRYSNIKISADCKYLLYSKKNNTVVDLVIKNLNDENADEIVVQNNISSNESGFLTSDIIYYSYSGNIYSYEISSEIKSRLVPHMANRCNHFPVFSPDKSKLVFKDQDTSKDDIATHAWSTIIDFKTETSDYNSILPYQDYNGSNPVNLYDDFYYSWRDNDHVIFKSMPGLTYKLMEQDLVTIGSQPTNANIQYNNNNVLFDKILISPDNSKLLLYGYKGVYLIDLTVEESMTGIIEAEQLYYSTNIQTQFGIFSSDSQYVLVATNSWIGLYDCDSLNKTLFSFSDYLDDDTFIYALTQTSNWDK